MVEEVIELSRVMQMLLQVGLANTVEYKDYNVKTNSLIRADRKGIDFYQDLLEDVNSSVVQGLLDKYEMDFRLFQYDDSIFREIVLRKRSAEKEFTFEE